jgi:alpha-1,6-mannosyltransferase
VAPVAGSLLLYGLIFLLLQGRSFRLTLTLTLYRFPGLGQLADRLTPDGLVNASWYSRQAALNAYLFGAAAVGLVLLWMWALRLARPGGLRLGLPVVLGVAALFSLPLILLPGMHSGDIYLYMFYGRTISRYGANPLIVSPNQFPADPHLLWVYWQWLPSAYGPLWLMLSGALSGIAGNALWANLLSYKAGMLVLHLLGTVAVWALLRDLRPQLATWGAIFYGWNPLALYESVGSGHNDVMVAMFLALGLLAAAHRRWPYAVFFVVAASMVKLMALVLLPPLVLAWLALLPGLDARLRALAAAGAAAAGGALVLSAPLWAGTALLRNVRENPAAKEYLNSLWDLLSHRLEPVNAAARVAFQGDLDVVRNAGFLLVFAALLWRAWDRREFTDVWVWTWVAYCLSLSWVWPWYFVVILPAAAILGPGKPAALAAALTLGGLLFWMGWPDPPLPAAPWLHNYRAFLLFGPVMLVAAWPRLSRAVERWVGRTPRVAS